MREIKAYEGLEPYLFISYSHSDPLALRLIEALDNHGFRLWYDKGIKSGSIWLDTIAERIENCSQFILLLSPNAAQSQYVQSEIFCAYDCKKEMRIFQLAETQLTRSMKMILQPIQHTLRSAYLSDAEFISALGKTLDPNTREKSTDGQELARQQLDQSYTLHNVVAQGLSTAYFGIHKRTNCAVFVKHYNYRNDKIGNRSELTNDISFLKDLHQCPFVPKVLDCYSDENNLYIVESWIHGKTLKQVMENDLNPEFYAHQVQCVDWIIKTAIVLRYVHSGKRPIIHRDIKPHNLFLGDMGDIYILDFGASRYYRPDLFLPNDEVCLGTIGYAAPEQYSNGSGQTDPRTDIYALGITFHQLLTGANPCAPPYDVYPLRYYDSRFHPVLEEIILKMISPDRQNRFQSAEDVIAALRSYDRCSKLDYHLARKRSDKRISQIVKKQKTAKPKKKAPGSPPAPAFIPSPVPQTSYPTPVAPEPGPEPITTVIVEKQEE